MNYKKVAGECGAWPSYDDIDALIKHQQKIDKVEGVVKKIIISLTGYEAEHVDVQGWPIVAVFMSGEDYVDVSLNEDDKTWKQIIDQALEDHHK